MSEYTPTTEEIKEALLWYQTRKGFPGMGTVGREEAEARFNRWAAEMERKSGAKALRDFAEYLEGGTPKAWQYEHPCDPGVFWEPSNDDQLVLSIAKTAQDQAVWIEKNENERKLVIRSSPTIPYKN